MTSERLLEEIRARLDILDVIADYVELKKSGQNYKGLCPFHSEKTASFMVSQDKQIFHCFGCGVGGNVISFVMKYENLSFPETLRLLAKKAGIDPKEFADGGQEGLKEKLVGILKQATEVFAGNLGKSKSASSYLAERGITGEIIGSFSLGYSLRDWHSLVRALRQKGIPESLILQAGIASSGEKGIYDTFRDRIMFAIRNAQGEVIAFGGRVMDDSQPKYLNSPDTPLFKKGDTLYGLNLAREGIKNKGYAMIVEGYFDVIVSHQHGFSNTVAPLGTALTPGHLQKLKRFTRKAVLVFDGDEAGKSAARRSIPLLLEQGFGAKILLLPEKDDPDSFLRRDGAAPFARLLSGSRSVVEFLLGTAKKEKAEAVRDALEVIAAAGDAIMKEELTRELSEKTGIRETVIREEMKKAGKGLKERTRTGGASPSPCPRPFICDEEVLLLSAAIAFPEKVSSILRAVPVGEFRNPLVRNILGKLGAEGGGTRLNEMISSLEEEERVLVTRLTVNPGFDIDAVEKNIEDCARRIGERKLDERLKRVHEEIRRAEGSGENDLLDTLLPERQKLMKEAR
jgi:DNA primase